MKLRAQLIFLSLCVISFYFLVAIHSNPPLEGVKNENFSAAFLLNCQLKLCKYIHFFTQKEGSLLDSRVIMRILFLFILQWNCDTICWRSPLDYFNRHLLCLSFASSMSLIAIVCHQSMCVCMWGFMYLTSLNVDIGFRAKICEGLCEKMRERTKSRVWVFWGLFTVYFKSIFDFQLG